MKSAGVVLLGAASGTFSLAHYNDIVGAFTITVTAGIVLMKFWRGFKKTFLTPEPPKQQEPKEETTVV